MYFKEMDFHADRILTRSQSKKKRAHPECAKDYRHVCSAIPMDYLTDDRPEYDISLRVVRVEISPPADCPKTHNFLAILGTKNARFFGHYLSVYSYLTSKTE